MPHDGRPITYIRKVIHLPQEGRGYAHRHELIWKGGGRAYESGTGIFFYFFRNTRTWVQGREEEQQICREIVHESEGKHHPRPKGMLR